MRVTRNGYRGYLLDQEEAIVDLRRDHGMTDANSSRVPIGKNVCEVQSADSRLLPATGAPVQPSVRAFSILWDRCSGWRGCTRPDIDFAVHKAIRQIHEPQIHDWKLDRHIVSYLCGMRALKISISQQSKKVHNLF